MNDNDNKTSRIAKNTLFLYFRMALMMLIGLYTSRVILNVLGVQDYGTYNVVGGVVGMFSLLTTSLSHAISRFLTFELGKGDKGDVNKVFCTALNVEFIMAIVVFLAIETVGVWFLNTHVQIPEGRMGAANWILQCSILSFVVGLLMVPYNATIISHERMNIYAYISIWNAVMKLVIVYALYISPFDKLKTYSTLLLCVSMLTTSFYWIYCKRNFKECSYRRVRDKGLLKEILSYAGWGAVGDGAWVLNTEGVNILINLFFGVTLNAARGIATTVDNVVQNFVRNFMTALKPQITKNYAAGEFESMHKLVFFGSKYSYFLTLFFMVPISLETKQILTLWLKLVPEYTVTFARLSLVGSMLMTLGNTLTASIEATGKIRTWEMVIGTMQLSIFPLTWIAFKVGLPPTSTYVIGVVIFFLLIFARILIVKGMIHMSGWAYINNVLLKALFVTIISYILPTIIYLFQEPSIWRLLEICIASVICTLSAIYYVGMNTSERDFAINILKKKLKRKS